MNETVKNILLGEYRDTRRKFVSAKDSMDSAINWRAKCENELLRAKAAEIDYAQRCQVASDKLDDILHFLKVNGVEP